MALQDTLDAIRRQVSANPLVRDAVAATLAELGRAGVGESALRPGEAFPDFLLPDTEGRLVGLADLPGAGRRASVVTFFRGDWCPYCGATMDALEAALDEIEAAGGTLVAVTPETGGRALDARRRHRLRYAVLADVDHGLATACGVAFRAPEAYRRMLASFGLDLAERHGNAAWLLPIPATFVLDAAGRVCRSFVDHDFTRRPDPSAIVAAVQEAAGDGP
jgi:peroxiredoxin